MALRRLFCLSFFTLALLCTSMANARDFDEGIEYQLITPPQPTQAPAGKIEVVEMFWYGCPHCFHFEPDIKKWLKKQGDNVHFIRIPATFNALWKFHARAFYTASVLGAEVQIHEPLFKRIHVQKKMPRNEKQMRQFFVQHGVKGQTFDEVFHSFAVDAKVRRAEELTQRYGIDGVPSMIVNGRYRVDAKSANTQKGMLEVVSFLIQQESKK